MWCDAIWKVGYYRPNLPGIIWPGLFCCWPVSTTTETSKTVGKSCIFAIVVVRMTVRYAVCCHHCSEHAADLAPPSFFKLSAGGCEITNKQSNTSCPSVSNHQDANLLYSFCHTRHPNIRNFCKRLETPFVHFHTTHQKISTLRHHIIFQILR